MHTKAGLASVMVATATGRSQGVKQVIAAAKSPTPFAFEMNCTVRHPELLNVVAETINPCNAVPVYSPRKVAPVELPSQMRMRSTGLGPVLLKLNTAQRRDMPSPGMSGQITAVKFSPLPY
jgi:hypothetical protein